MASTGSATTAIRRRARPAGTLHAVDAMIEAIEANPGIVVVTLGPLTNLALAVTRKPALAAQVGRCVVMGGAPCCEGNVTPAAEYNIWVDPEAARTVMLSGLPVELVGWQTCRGDAVLNEGDIAKILGFNNDLARFAIECNSRAREAYKEQTGEDGISLPDPVAMSVALDPTIGTQWSEHYRGGRDAERVDAGDDGCGSPQRGRRRTEPGGLGRGNAAGKEDQSLLDDRQPALEGSVVCSIAMKLSRVILSVGRVLAAERRQPESAAG